MKSDTYSNLFTSGLLCSSLCATPKQINLALVKVSHSLKTLPGFGCLREELITGL